MLTSMIDYIMFSYVCVLDKSWWRVEIPLRQLLQPGHSPGENIGNVQAVPANSADRLVFNNVSLSYNMYEEWIEPCPYWNDDSENCSVPNHPSLSACQYVFKCCRRV